MIVVDTGVLSEPLRARPDPKVLAWLREHARDIGLTTITVGELLFGASRLDAGRRRDGLLAAIEAVIAGAGPRVLPYDEDAARHFAQPCRSREIAARNTRDFDGAGLDVVNPWQS